MSLFSRVNKIACLLGHSLMRAIEEGDEELVRTTLAKTRSGRIPKRALFEAARINAIETTRLLVEAGANVDAKLKVKVEVRSRQECRGYRLGSMVWEEGPTRIVCCRRCELTPLCFAALLGRIEVVEHLVQCGADVNASAIGYGFTPLCLAAVGGHLQVVEFLLENQASVEAAYGTGVTPLYAASRMGHSDVARILLDAGADMNAVCSEGFTPLYMASKYGHLHAARVLVEAGADVNCGEAKFDFTPLHVATKSGRVEVVRLLVKSGSDVDRIAANNLTPLCVSEITSSELLRLYSAEIGGNCSDERKNDLIDDMAKQLKIAGILVAADANIDSIGVLRLYWADLKWALMTLEDDNDAETEAAITLAKQQVAAYQIRKASGGSREEELEAKAIYLEILESISELDRERQQNRMSNLDEMDCLPDLSAENFLRSSDPEVDVLGALVHCSLL